MFQLGTRNDAQRYYGSREVLSWLVFTSASPLLIQGKHPLDQGDHLVVASLVGRIGEVDTADGDYFHTSYQNLIYYLLVLFSRQ